MWKKLIIAFVALVLVPQLGNAQEAKAVLDGVVKAMGDVKSLQYAGSGANFALGQNPSPTAPSPRFNLKSFTRTIDYDTPSMRDEFVRTQAEPGARGGGGLPLSGEQRQIQAVSGTHAWNQAGDAAPAPCVAAVADRLHQLWITPHGVIKAAMKHNATVETQTEGGKKMTIISFAVPGELKVKAFVNERNLVEKVKSWNTNPVLGDMLTETTYADYKDFGGVQFPTKITQKAGGLPYPRSYRKRGQTQRARGYSGARQCPSGKRQGADGQSSRWRVVPDRRHPSQRAGGDGRPSGGDRRAAGRRPLRSR